jgi:hypothetical protein
MVVCRETKEKKRDWSGGLVGVGLTRTLSRPHAEEKEPVDPEVTLTA